MSICHIRLIIWYMKRSYGINVIKLIRTTKQCHKVSPLTKKNIYIIFFFFFFWSWSAEVKDKYIIFSPAISLGQPTLFESLPNIYYINLMIKTFFYTFFFNVYNHTFYTIYFWVKENYTICFWVKEKYYWELPILRVV